MLANGSFWWSHPKEDEQVSANEWSETGRTGMDVVMWSWLLWNNSISRKNSHRMIDTRLGKIMNPQNTGLISYTIELDDGKIYRKTRSI